MPTQGFDEAADPKVTLQRFVAENIEPGTRVIADGWSCYPGITTLGYNYEPRSQRVARARGKDPGALLPAVHRVISLVKHWVLGAHQGSVSGGHLQSYLDEFAFRVSLRNSSGLGLNFFDARQLAVNQAPVRYGGIITAHQRKRTHPIAPNNEVTRRAWTVLWAAGQGETCSRTGSCVFWIDRSRLDSKPDARRVGYRPQQFRGGMAIPLAEGPAEVRRV